MAALLMFSLSAYSYAGIKDKKAQKESELTMNTAASEVKSACGNAKLDVDIDWTNWDQYDYSKMSGKAKKATVISYTGNLVKSVLDEMVELCKDADYKAELAKISSFKISGKKDQKDRYVAFSLSDTTLNITLNADGITSWKNAKLLKAVWE